MQAEDGLRVLHLISGLGVGGAERTLQRLVVGLAARGVAQQIVSLAGLGVIGEQLKQAGYPVATLGIGGPASLLQGLGRLGRILASFEPHVFQTWMYHADLLGALLRGRAPGAALAWNLRGSRRGARELGWRTYLVARTCARLSPRADVAVANSWAGREGHARMGYRPRRWLVIPNGVDLQRFRPDAARRAQARRALGVSQETVLIGSVGRDHPIKGYEHLISAFGRLAGEYQEIALALLGRGLDPGNPRLAAKIEAEGLAGRVHLLGPQEDVARWLPAFDLFVSPSLSEGFPNAVAEAMASGVPCVVTEVGDSARLVGETGRVVPPGDARALAEAIRALLALSPEARRQLGAAARARVEENYSLVKSVQAYYTLYVDLAAGRRR